MQQREQEIYSYQNDAIDLRKILNSLIARKFLIFGLTAFVTLLAIIVAFNITPIYKAVSKFTSPSVSSVDNINKLNMTSESKTSVFSNFLTLLSSKEFQKEVFIDGGYLTEFNPQNDPINDVNSFISGSIVSVQLSPPGLTKKDLDFGFLTELPYSISMEGTNPIVITNYLNELVAAADAKTTNELINLLRQKTSIRLEQISIERHLLLAKEKQRRSNEIEVLSDAAQIAKSLGIIENNLNQIVGDKYRSDHILSDNQTQTPPDWYLYGEKALQERVNVLKNRTSDEAFIPDLIDLDNEKLKLQSGLIDTIEFTSMQLNQAAITPIFPIKPNKKLIVLLAFIGGFMISILLALTINALEPDEKTLSK